MLSVIFIGDESKDSADMTATCNLIKPSREHLPAGRQVRKLFYEIAGNIVGPSTRMNEIVKVSDMMTNKIITLDPDDGLDKVTKMFEQYKYDGFPVVNKEGVLLGIVTAYDMVSQSYATHLPSLLNILEDISKEKADAGSLKDHFESLKDIKARDIMNEDPLVVGPEVRVEDLAKEFIQHHRVNPIPVVDANKKMLGVVSRFDIIKFFDEIYFNKILTDIGHGGILQRLERLGDK